MSQPRRAAPNPAEAVAENIEAMQEIDRRFKGDA